MKHALLLLLVAPCLCSVALAQVVETTQVPAAVRQAFQARFPAVKAVAWTMKSDNCEAEFTSNGAGVAVKFDPVGKWLETESAIPRSKVPSAVRDAVARRYRGHNVIETQTVQRWNEQRVIYEIHLENAREIVKAQFYADGAMLNQSTKPKAAKEKQ
jgi:hypothetical protein